MTDLVRISIDNGAVAAVVNIWFAIGIIAAIILLSIAFPWVRNVLFRDQYEVDEVELGIGSGKVTLKPNHEDLQIAYGLWVELQTRKLGLRFDEEHDVVIEVYNSWYEFFRITRDLIKSVPIAKIRARESTQLLVSISIDILNKAIRPHLTKWQARFRHWYEVERQKASDASPQEVQKKFPQYRELVSELKNTNLRLVAYAKMLTTILRISPSRWGA